MNYEEYMKRLDEIENKIKEARMAPPGDIEMIWNDVKQLFKLTKTLYALALARHSKF